MNDPILPQADPPPGLCTGEDERDGEAAHAGNRARMDPEERKNMILDGAIAFFAKHGFKAQTRELARHLGVSQSLIYHYFSTKEQLIERINERTCPTQLRNRWQTILTDRKVPI